MSANATAEVERPVVDLGAVKLPELHTPQSRNVRLSFKDRSVCCERASAAILLRCLASDANSLCSRQDCDN
jgi:hypothetical protein